MKEVVNAQISFTYVNMFIYNTSIFTGGLLENYLGTSHIIGNLMIIRVTSVEWTWVGYSDLLPNMVPCTQVI